MPVYLALASALWVTPSEQGQPGGPGDGFYWFMLLVPIVGLVTIINLVVLFRLLFQYRVNRSPVPLLLWLIVMLAWGNVLLFDHMKAVRYIDSKYAQQGTPADVAVPPV